MNYLPESIKNLTEEFAKLPGIGQKSAEKLVFELLKNSQKDLEVFSSSLKNLKKDLVYCEKCFHLTTSDLCDICRDNKRDPKTLCVVSSPLDLVAIEKTGKYRGLYHVLHGHISPIDNMGPDDLKIKELKNRIKDESIKEVIIATNPTLEGEATAIYINNLIKPFKLKITKIARGLPTGGDLEYADEQTLSLALEGRRGF